MWDRFFAAHAEPAVAGVQAVEPGFDDVVRNALVAPHSEREIAGLGAAEAAAGAIDRVHRNEAKILAVIVAEIGVLLTMERGDSFLSEAIGECDADRLGLLESDQAGGSCKAEGGIVGGVADQVVVIGPTTASERVTGEHVGLGLSEVFVFSLKFRVVFSALV